MIGQFILRILIWFLLTANLSITNIIIGISICLLMPRYRSEPLRLGSIIQGFQKVMTAIPQAYIEAIEMIWHPHNYEDITIEKAQNRRSAALIFLDIFVITFTPKTIVLKHHEDGWYSIHRVGRHIAEEQQP